MKKQEFYKIQADAFRNYAGKFSDRELLPLFNEWAESKDMDEVDRDEILEMVRKQI